MKLKKFLIRAVVIIAVLFVGLIIFAICLPDNRDYSELSANEKSKIFQVTEGYVSGGKYHPENDVTEMEGVFRQVDRYYELSSGTAEKIFNTPADNIKNLPLGKIFQILVKSKEKPMSIEEVKKLIDAPPDKPLPESERLNDFVDSRISELINADSASERLLPTVMLAKCGKTASRRMGLCLIGDDPYTKAYILMAYQAIADPTDEYPIDLLLSDRGIFDYGDGKPRFVASAAAKALGEMDNPSAIFPLEQALKEAKKYKPDSKNPIDKAKMEVANEVLIGDLELALIRVKQ